MLKFKIFINNLFLILININFLFYNQYYKYIIIFKKVKNNIFMILKKTNFLIY